MTSSKAGTSDGSSSGEDEESLRELVSSTCNKLNCKRSLYFHLAWCGKVLGGIKL